MSPSYPSASSPWTPGWIAGAAVLGLLLAGAAYSFYDLVNEGKARAGETARLAGLQRLHRAVAAEFAASQPAPGLATDEASERASLDRVCAQFQREARVLDAWSTPPPAVQRAGDGLTTVCNMPSKKGGATWRGGVERALTELQGVLVDQGQLALEAREEVWWRRLFELGTLTALLASVLVGLVQWRRNGNHPSREPEPRTVTTHSTPPQWMRSAIESSSEGIVMVDPQGEIRAVNPAAERLFGSTRNELLGQRAEERIPEYVHSRDGLRGEWLQTVLRGADGVELTEKRDVSWYRRDDHSFTILHIQPASIRPSAGSRRSSAAPQPASSPALGPGEVDPESLQQLENQILLVTGYGEVALSNLAESDPIRPDIEQLARAGARAALLCREATMRPVNVDKVPVHLNAFLKSFEQRLRALMADGADILRRADSVAGTVETDAELLEQTLLALALHAAPTIREPLLIRVASSLGRIELTLHTRGAVNLQWHADAVIKPHRALQWLDALGATIEHEVADRGGHRFRLQLPRQAPLALLPPAESHPQLTAAEPEPTSTSSPS